eukprot:TRINITY_DN7586_c0_g2_i1.p1 TRINITY_DN7586_c0_g2~~TRINITY_DN7586_c0_g2_i1.p1  ORF type:complete len:916 (-),score=142.26 TRINITY_DN7586_c0_g2_i1:6-2639(-)
MAAAAPTSSSYGATDESGAAADELKTGKGGLTQEEATLRLQKYGVNELPEKEDNRFVKFLLEFVQPMPIIIWLAIALETTEYVVEHRVECLLDAGVLLLLQILNVAIGFIEELKAGNEVAALKASLRPEAVVVRDSNTQTLPARELVPGDIVILSSGSAVPADCLISEGEKPLQVDQAALTGESLAVTMRAGDTPKMGSLITRGESEAIVVGTGANTFFGKTAALINTVDDHAHFELVLRELLIFLVTLGVLVCTLMLLYLKLVEQETLLHSARFIAVLLIASIPVALRVVCTCTLALGCKELANEEAIVARLSSIEELAGMNILCSDKTGTLTLNKMVLQEDLPLFDEQNAKRGDVLTYAALAMKWWEPPKDALDTLVLGAVDGPALTEAGYKQTDYTPFDPSTRRTEAIVSTPQGKTMRLMKGAPDVVLKLCDGNRDQVKKLVDETVANLAKRGIRSLGVASSDGETAPYRFLGVLTFLDPPRPDSKLTLDRAKRLGVSIKMLTGDHLAIAEETSRTLGLGSVIHDAEGLPVLAISEINERMSNLGDEFGERFENADGFAQVLPEHKFLIVETLRKRGHLVGMTGDGVNDAPALKRADVGIAVSGATGAAMAAADIVLTREGLSVVVSAIINSRKVFQRMKNFVIYRVACTVQLLFFFFLSTLFFNPAEIDPEWTERYFAIPVVGLVCITILNDGTIVSVAYDNVDASAVPEKWNLWALYVVSIAIGMTALLSSLVLLYIVLHSHKPGSTWQAMGLERLTYEQAQTVMYLKISLSDYLSVFNSRCKGWMCSRMPSHVVVGAAFLAMSTSIVFSIRMPPGMQIIEGKSATFICVYCFCWGVIQDIAKIASYAFLHHFGFVDDAGNAEDVDYESLTG